MSERHFRISLFDQIQVVFSYGFVVDGLLDARLAKDSLETLITQKWRLLGARMRRDSDGNLFYAVPDLFDDQHQPCTFELRIYKEPLVSHITLPQPTDFISTHEVASLEIFRPPPALRNTSVSDYVNGNQPIFHLQISHFSDNKSAIGLTAPHIFYDGAGAKEVFRALGALMNGAPLDSIGELQEDTLIMEKIPVKLEDGWEPENAWILDSSIAEASVVVAVDKKEEPEMRAVCIPQKIMDEMVEDCRAKLDGQWVSESDVLMGWWVKTIFSSTPPERFNDPITIGFPINIRSRFPDYFPGIYLHNALTSVYYPFSTIASLVAVPIHELALNFRTSIKQSTPDAIAKNLAFSTRVYYSTPDHHIQVSNTPPKGDRMSLSNWLQLQWGDDSFMPRLENGKQGDIIWFGGGAVGKGTQEKTRSLGGTVQWRRDGVWLRYTLDKSWWTRGDLARMSRS